MANFKVYKEISAIPTPYTPNAIYFIRVGKGFDLYMADSTGTGVFQLNDSDGIMSTTLTSGTSLGASIYNTFLSNGANLVHTLPNPATYPNKEWTITNINSTPATLMGTLHGDVNPLIYQWESFNFYSDGTNLYLKA